MLKLRHFLTVMGLALAVSIAPAQAVERSSGGTTNRNTAVDVKIETINTFLKSVTERIETDMNAELGYDTPATNNCEKDPKACRIYKKLIDLREGPNGFNKLKARWQAIKASQGKIKKGNEADPYACGYVKAATVSCSTNERLRWNGSAWSCAPKAVWETGGTCVTATLPAPQGCAQGVLNCCSKWVCKVTGTETCN